MQISFYLRGSPFSQTVSLSPQISPCAPAFDPRSAFYFATLFSLPIPLVVVLVSHRAGRRADGESAESAKPVKRPSWCRDKLRNPRTTLPLLSHAGRFGPRSPLSRLDSPLEAPVSKAKRHAARTYDKVVVFIAEHTRKHSTTTTNCWIQSIHVACSLILTQPRQFIRCSRHRETSSRSNADSAWNPGTRTTSTHITKHNHPPARTDRSAQVRPLALRALCSSSS